MSYTEKRVKIRLTGCDDETAWLHDVSEDEYAFLLVLAERSREMSQYHCQPKLKVEEVS